jgi:hypothetical protein
MDTDTDRIFPTYDIPLIAFLMTKNHEILKTEQTGSNRVCFYFDLTPQLQSDVFNHSNDGLVPSQQYYRNLTKIWRIIKEGGLK